MIHAKLAPMHALAAHGEDHDDRMPAGCRATCAWCCCRSCTTRWRRRRRSASCRCSTRSRPRCAAPATTRCSSTRRSRPRRRAGPLSASHATLYTSAACGSRLHTCNTLAACGPRLQTTIKDLRIYAVDHVIAGAGSCALRKGLGWDYRGEVLFNTESGTTVQSSAEQCA